jgi:hypothetical protein
LAVEECRQAQPCRTFLSLHPPLASRTGSHCPEKAPTSRPPPPTGTAPTPLTRPPRAGLSLPQEWRCALGAGHRTSVDLYQLYQAVVMRGGIPSKAPDEDWLSLLRACMVLGNPGPAAPNAMRALFAARIRGFLDFMADLVKQYEIAKRDGGAGGGGGAAAGGSGSGGGSRQQLQPRGASNDNIWAQTAARQRPAPGSGAKGGSSSGGARPAQQQQHHHHPKPAAAAARTPEPQFPDPVPGDRLRSMLVFMRAASLGLAEKPYSAATAPAAALARRYRAGFARLKAASRCDLPQELYPLFGAKERPPAPRRSGRSRPQRASVSE